MPHTCQTHDSVLVSFLVLRASAPSGCCRVVNVCDSEPSDRSTFKSAMPRVPSTRRGDQSRRPGHRRAQIKSSASPPTQPSRSLSFSRAHEHTDAQFLGTTSHRELRHSPPPPPSLMALMHSGADVKLFIDVVTGIWLKIKYFIINAALSICIINVFKDIPVYYEGWCQFSPIRVQIKISVLLDHKLMGRISL